MEEEHDGACIVLASHADTLQIAQTYIAGADARTFSQYRFANGEVKRIHTTILYYFYTILLLYWAVLVQQTGSSSSF